MEVAAACGRASSRSAAGVRTSVLIGLVVVAAVWLVGLPFAAVSLVRRRDFGLSEQGWAGWLVDQLTTLGVQAVLVTIGVAGAVWLAGRFGRRQVVGAPALVGIAALFIVLQPLRGAAAFQSIRAAGKWETRRRDRGPCGQTRREGRRRPRCRRELEDDNQNAYVAGLWPTRRVVLYDTLLDGRFTDGEI